MVQISLKQTTTLMGLPIKAHNASRQN